LKHTDPIPGEWHILKKQWVLARQQSRGVYILTGLDGAEAADAPPEAWLTVNGNPAFAYTDDNEHDMISVLAELDGRRVSLAASYKDGKFLFLGAIPEAKDGRAPLPGYVPVEEGDTVTLLYPKLDTRRPGHSEMFERGKPFILERPPAFAYEKVDGIYGMLLTDGYNNEYVTELRQVISAS
jgi:hypothetical protein